MTTETGICVRCCHLFVSLFFFFPIYFWPSHEFKVSVFFWFAWSPNLSDWLHLSLALSFSLAPSLSLVSFFSPVNLEKKHVTAVVACYCSRRYEYLVSLSSAMGITYIAMIIFSLSYGISPPSSIISVVFSFLVHLIWQNIDQRSKYFVSL